MPIMMPLSIPEVSRTYLMNSIVFAECTFYYSLKEYTYFTVFLHEDGVFVCTEAHVYMLPGLRPCNNLYDVFRMMEIDYYGIDITSNILLNHIHAILLSRPMENIEPIAMNIYSYEVIVHDLKYGGITTEASVQTVREEIPTDHISSFTAIFVLDE